MIHQDIANYSMLLFQRANVRFDCYEDQGGVAISINLFPEGGTSIEMDVKTNDPKLEIFVSKL